MNAQVNNQPDTEHWSQIRTEGQHRSQRIGQIFKTAFSEARSEFKVGFNHIRPLAQEMTETVVDDVRGKSTQAVTKVRNVWTAQANNPDLIIKIKGFIKTLLGELPDQVVTQVRKQAEQVEFKLDQRYGERYQSTKQRFKMVRDWYIHSTEPEAEEPFNTTQAPMAAVTTVDVNVIEVENH